MMQGDEQTHVIVLFLRQGEEVLDLEGGRLPIAAVDEQLYAVGAGRPQKVLAARARGRLRRVAEAPFATGGTAGVVQGPQGGSGDARLDHR